MRRFLPIVCLIVVAATILVTPSRGQVPHRRSDAANDRTPIVPVIPSADRQSTNRVFLEQADRLSAAAGTDYQVLVGNVKFRRGGMFMYCDSAHFYDRTGSFDAFGNVRMEQGDTLFVYADELNYNDSLQLCVLYGDAERKVRLINRDVELRTSVFNYDLGLDLGYYDVGGELFDPSSRLTSIEGEYSPSTKEANFRFNAHLTSVNQGDTVEIFSEDIYYNTASHIARLEQDSRIISKDGTIFTSNGIYYSDTQQSELFDRSVVVASNGNTLTGDTIYYDRVIGQGRVYGSMELCDTTNKIILRGHYGFYNELTDSVFVTGRAQAVEYSQGDSLWLHGDTIRAFRVINLPDTLAAKPQTPTAENEQATLAPRPQGFIAGADSLAVGRDSLPADSLAVKPSESLPEIVKPVETLPEVKPETARPEPEAVRQEPDTLRFIVAAPRVKFYRVDLQGFCDSMTVVSSDSTIRLDYSPMIWSENRQILGDRVILHLNDSTVESAHIPSGAMMGEEIEEDFYNQLSGKKMDAAFTDGQLRHLDVSGNVLAITFPEENDSTINKVVNLESSYLAADFKDNNIEKMKTWPETNASVTPLYLAKKSLFYLPGFKWWGELRPTGPDDIFVFPEALVTILEESRRRAANASK